MPDPVAADAISVWASGDTTGGGYATPDPPTASPDGYLLLDEVGRGGMGVVYRARDLALGREVALKVLSERCAGVAAVARFVDEARVTGKLQHPGIPAVHQTGVLPDGRPFLAMKLIRGRTLDDLLKARDTPAADRGRFLGVFEAVGQAVGYAHAQGVVHRDLKPQNVMVGAFGEVQVMDWGLAKSARPGASTTAPDDNTSASDDDATRDGVVLGTPAYMPPEQATGAVDRIDARSDVFGLGAILCVILTGRPPYVGGDALTTREMAAVGDLTAAHARLDASAAEPDLVALCKRCLSPDRADRPATAGDVADAVAGLRAAAEARARAAELEQQAAAVRAAEDRKRRRVVSTAAWVVAAVLAVGTGVSAWQAARAELARHDAVAEAGNARTAERNERTARQDAVRQKDAAVQQEAAATATKDFLKSVLRLSTPDEQIERAGRADTGLTLRETLQLAAQQLDGRFEDQPLIEAELRDTIGGALERLGAYAAAVPFTRAALALYERELGEDDPRTLDCAHTLGVLEHRLGRPGAALPLFTRVAEGYARQLGPDDKNTIAANVQLGFAMTVERNLAAAEPILTRARDDAERVVGPDHFITLFATYSLGLLNHNADRFDRAEPYFRRSATGFERLVGADHPHTIESVSLLGHGYQRRKMAREAEPLLERASRVRDQVLGPRHPDALGSAIYLGFLYDDTGRGPDADPLWQRVYDDRGKLPQWAADTWMPHWAQVRVGARLTTEAKYDEAERVLLDGYHAMLRTEPPRDAVVDAVGFLIALYVAAGRPDDVAKWRAERERYLAGPREVAPAPRVVPSR